MNDNLVKDLNELCDTLARAISSANEKIRNAGGKVSAADTDFLDKLTHSLKSVKTTIAMIEAEDDDGDYSERYSRDGSYRRGYSRDSYGYARGGRGRNARRDSMGRYSNRDGYSRDGGDLADELRELMDSAPDDQTRQEMMRLVQKIEQR